MSWLPQTACPAGSAANRDGRPTRNTPAGDGPPEGTPLNTERRYLSLNAYLRNSGYHEAAWRISPADPAAVLDPRHYIDVARTAERGVLDSVFLPDSPGVAEFRSEYLPGAGLDPLQPLSSLATATEQVGLIATVSTTYSYPWDTARRLATLDFLSHGRAGGNIVTTAAPAAGGNFGAQPHPPAADRYDRAGEYVEVVLKLWDAWEDGAAIMSRSAGRWADPARLHPPRHPPGAPPPAPPPPPPRPILRRLGLPAVPPLTAGPPVPDPGRVVSPGRCPGRPVRRRRVHAPGRHHRGSGVPPAPEIAGRRTRPRPRPGQDPARPVLPARWHRRRGRGTEGRAGGGRQQRVPLAQPGQPGRAGLRHHRSRRAVPARAAGWRPQDQLRRVHLPDGRARTGRHLPGRRREAVRPAPRAGPHPHPAGHG